MAPKKPEKLQPPEAGDPKYHCSPCGATYFSKVPHCPVCGATWDQSQVKEVS